MDGGQGNISSIDMQKGQLATSPLQPMNVSLGKAGSDLSFSMRGCSSVTASIGSSIHSLLNNATLAPFSPLITCEALPVSQK
jgi:hypothetical protein